MACREEGKLMAKSNIRVSVNLTLSPADDWLIPHIPEEVTLDDINTMSFLAVLRVSEQMPIVDREMERPLSHRKNH